MRGLTGLALCVTATALAPAPVWRACARLRRTCEPVAVDNPNFRSSWTTRATPDGTTYYFNEQTGQSQWEPPQSATAQQGGGASVRLCLVPATGVYGEYFVCNGEEQVLGRHDMAEQKLTVSRAQCLVQVAADGTATVVSLGKRPTGLRRHGGAPWYGLELHATHALLDGEQIALDMDSGESFGWQGQPYTAIFTCHVDKAADYTQQGQYGANPQYGQVGGNPQYGQYDNNAQYQQYEQYGGGPSPDPYGGHPQQY